MIRITYDYDSPRLGSREVALGLLALYRATERDAHRRCGDALSSAIEAANEWRLVSAARYTRAAWGWWRIAGVEGEKARRCEDALAAMEAS